MEKHLYKSVLLDYMDLQCELEGNSDIWISCRLGILRSLRRRIHILIWLSISFCFLFYSFTVLPVALKMNWLVLLDMFPVILKNKFRFHSKHWFCTNDSLTLLACRSHWVVSYIPLPPVFDHSTILSLVTALWFVNYLVSGVGSWFLNWWGRD